MKSSATYHGIPLSYTVRFQSPQGIDLYKIPCTHASLLWPYITGSAGMGSAYSLAQEWKVEQESREVKLNRAGLCFHFPRYCLEELCFSSPSLLSLYVSMWTREQTDYKFHQVPRCSQKSVITYLIEWHFHSTTGFCFVSTWCRINQISRTKREHLVQIIWITPRLFVRFSVLDSLMPRFQPSTWSQFWCSAQCIAGLQASDWSSSTKFTLCIFVLHPRLVNFHSGSPHQQPVHVETPLSTGAILMKCVWRAPGWTTLRGALETPQQCLGNGALCAHRRHTSTSLILFLLSFYWSFIIHLVILLQLNGLFTGPYLKLK